MQICQNCQIKVREQIIKQHIEQGVSISQLAKISGRHENTLYAWKAKYLESGIDGLKDVSRAPHRHQNEYPDDIKERIIELRKEGLIKERRYIGPQVIAWRMEKRFGIKISPSGIGKFLHRANLIPEQNRRRRPKKERVAKCRIHDPGELLQVDVKYAVKSYAGYWFYEYDAIDYMTGIVHGEIYEIQSNFESILFLQTLIKKYPFIIQGIQTDNGSVFTNYYTGYKKSADPMKPRLHCLDLWCQQRNINHYLIDPGKPAQNGKIERFHRTVEEELYQNNSFKDLNSLRKKFRDYLYYYNNEREHQSLGGLTPVEKLRTFPKYEIIKEIIN